MPSIAICYHGMTRSTRFVYQTHYENVFNVLKSNNATFDVYLHTWKTNNNWVWTEDIHVPNDYTEHNFLNPTRYQIDDQDEFLKTIDFSIYNNETDDNRKWVPELIRNYMCALESQKRCFNMCVSSNIKYDYVIFIRPDIEIIDKLPYDKIFDSKIFEYNSIFIPHDNWFDGYNDRFAITTFNNALWYSHRSNETEEYRIQYGCVFAEKYAKYIIDKYYKLMPISFRFLLVRSNGS